MGQNNFAEKDLKQLKEALEKQKREIQEFAKYSLRKKEESKIKRIERIIREINKLLNNEKELEDFLQKLNIGNFKFKSGNVLTVIEPFYLKVRITFSLTRKNYLDYIALKLISKKLEKYLSVNSVNRNSTISRLVKFLRSSKRKETNFYVLRGDFRNYTLNIPRAVLFELLKEESIDKSLLRLIENYFKIENNYSISFKDFNVKSFFKNFNFEKQFLNDVEFNSFLNYDGLLPGTPLSNLLGQFFLKEFDIFIEEFIGKEGFYIRFFDDFIIIWQCDIRDIKKEIYRFLRKHYKLFQKDEISNIVKIETYKNRYYQNLNSAKFDFLGYLFITKDEDIKITIRYKTLKKFLIKYLHTYKYYGNGKPKELKDYLTSKVVYLNSWLKSFIFINDKRLLDNLYINFILPDLYRTLKKEKKIKEPKRTVKKLKNLFKPTLIHRHLIKNRNENILERINFIEKEIEKLLE